MVDEVVEEGEYHDEALEAAQADYLADKVVRLSVDQGHESAFAEEHDVVVWAQTICSKTAYASTIQSRTPQDDKLTCEDMIF